MLLATFRPYPSLTTTVRMPGRRLAAWAQALSSPETSPTGTPYVPANTAFSSASVAGSPFRRTS